MTTFTDTLTSLITDPHVAGIRITTPYTSATGPTVTPPAGTLRTSEGGKPRDVQGEFPLPNGQTAVTIDSWGSQASRMETALEGSADPIGYPLIRFTDTTGTVLTTSVRLSHRHADATWRASQRELENAGIPFTDIQRATVSAAEPLLRWFPTAIVFGWWHSHINNKKSQDKATKTAKALGKAVADSLAGYARIGEDARSARLLTSEIIATGVARRIRMPARQDSLFGPLAGLASTSTVKPSELGIGSLPPMRSTEGPVDVTYQTIEGTAFFSLAGLRRFHFPTATDEQHTHEHERRVLVVLLGLLMHTLMQHDLRLRAGAELLIAEPGPSVETLRHGHQPEPLTLPDTSELIQTVQELGHRVGWHGPRDITVPDDSVLHTLLNTSDADNDTE